MLHDFRPSKRFGQNFLIDHNIIRKSVHVAGITKYDIVLEIGPGKGILTQALARNSKKVIAIELDRTLFHELQTSLAHQDNIMLHCADILKVDLKQLLSHMHIVNKVTVVANIPYNITTPIIEYLFRNIELFADIFIMVQKEYAERLIARPNSKDYSSLSCFARFFCEPKILFGVSRSCFRPRPKVDSSFIQLHPREKEYWKSLGLINETFLLTLIRTAFNQRRKTLLNSLDSLAVKERLREALASFHIKTTARPEELSLVDFIRLSNALS